MDPFLRIMVSLRVRKSVYVQNLVTVATQISLLL